jgi:MATE family multidrug resistance protein
MPPLGLSVACGIRIGQLCGEVDARRAKLAYAAAWTLDTAFVAVNAVFVLAAGPVWAWVFTDDEGVVALVASTIWMLALYSMFDSWQCVAAGGLRGLGLPGYGAAANVVGWVSVGLPLAYVFAIVLNWGLQGIWVGFTAAVACTFALMSATLVRKDWHAIAVASRERALQDVVKPAAATAAVPGGAAAASDTSCALSPNPALEKLPAVAAGS